MKVIALLVVIGAWACLFLWRGTLARVVQLIVFGLLGTVFTLAGGFAYWWDSHMRPEQSSSLLFVCGLLTLLPQIGALLMSMLLHEVDVEGPRRKPPARRPPRR
jgi:uncharacterized membrane protein YccC